MTSNELNLKQYLSDLFQLELNVYETIKELDAKYGCDAVFEDGTLKIYRKLNESLNNSLALEYAKSKISDYYFCVDFAN